MQIINTIEIVCSICGKSMPVEKNIDREFEMNRYIFRVMPCACNGKQQPRQAVNLTGAISPAATCIKPDQKQYH